MTGTLATAGLVWAGAAAFFALVWLLLSRRREWELVDSLWALSLGATGAAVAWFADGDPGRRVLMAALVLAWSGRLGHHLFAGRWRKGIRDGRYSHWTASLGRREKLWMFGFFQLQALSVALLAVPYIVVAADTRTLDTFDLASVGVFLVSLAGESRADRTLNRFRLDPANRGRTCREGLWAWSRHPNYFFEWIHWFCYPLLAAGAPASWVGPVVMYGLLTRVSGIPLTEAQALRSRGEDYRDYQRTTSMFFPRPPKQEGVTT